MGTNDDLYIKSDHQRWKIQGMIQSYMTDMDHDTLLEVAEFVLKEHDPEVVKYRELLESTRD